MGMIQMRGKFLKKEGKSMILGRRKLLQGENLRSHLQFENMALDSSKDGLSMVTMWRAECLEAETQGCISR